MTSSRGRMTLPALRAHMGDWIYYITFFRLSTVADRVSIAKDIHSSTSLQEILQRGLSSRAGHIRDYLLRQPQRFFSGLVVASYGGAPSWSEVKVNSNPDGEEVLSDDLEGILGLLELDGSEKLFAVDGQHRVAGIKAAVRRRPELGNEEVCVILVPGVTQEHRNDDPEGFERTRRLFSTLNRYAKPVSKRDKIAIDEDDIVAITTRHLVEEYPLFQEKVSPGQGTSIPVGDVTSFTTLGTLYDVLDSLLSTGRGWASFKRFRPSDADIDIFVQRARDFWDLMIAGSTPLQELTKSSPQDHVAGRYRDPRENNALFRPIGLLAFSKAIRALVDRGVSLTTAVERATRVEQRLGNEPWVGLLWDPINQRVLTYGENRRVALKLLFYMIGGDLTAPPMKTSTSALLTEWAGILNVDPAGLKLPARVV